MVLCPGCLNPRLCPLLPRPSSCLISRQLMGSTELSSSLPLSAFHSQSPTFSRCYSCCVFSRLSLFFVFCFFPETVSNLFILLPKFIFPLHRSQPLCFPLAAVAQILALSLATPRPHSPLLTPGPFVSIPSADVLDSLSFHQEWQCFKYYGYFCLSYIKKKFSKSIHVISIEGRFSVRGDFAH